MNFKTQETQQKLRGGYYTGDDITEFLTKWVLLSKPRRILEPSCGDGAFISSVLRKGKTSVRELFGCEIIHSEANKALKRDSLNKNINVNIHIGDFLSWYLKNADAVQPFDAVLGNPPFIRYQYLDTELQANTELVFRRLGLPFTKHTNAWVPFVLTSIDLLRPEGRIAMVVPSEIIHVLHAKPLRDYLAHSCSRVLLLDPNDILFSDTLQGVMLLLAEKKGKERKKESQISINTINARDELNGKAEYYFSKSHYISSSKMNGKWMLALLSSKERDLLNGMTNFPQIKIFDDIAAVDVGIVTGANKFFLVTDEIVSTYDLQKWAHPMFGRSEHVPGVIYDKKTHNQNKDKGFPTNFLWFEEEFNNKNGDGVSRYIKLGESQKLHERYKCRIRRPWYAVPSVYASRIGMLKRCHNMPRLILNTRGAFTTDTAYRIRLKESNNDNEISIVYSFVNSLTALTAELEGRHYGGGVLELVPSEIERLLIPLTTCNKKQLNALDRLFRSGATADEILDIQDENILHQLGLSVTECHIIREALLRLRNRRQRKPIVQ